MNENGLDQFYTNTDTSLKCYNKLQQIIDIHTFDILLEPSAGTGSFFNIMDDGKKIGIDIDPKDKGILKMDFFDYKPISNKKYLVLGNPPFGKISSIAVKFFNKSAEFADCIAFIIPRTFKRVSIQNKLDLHFKLIYNEDIPVIPCCFTPKMNAKCCFQIWVRTNDKRDIIEYDKEHPDFTFVKHGPKDTSGQPTPPENCDFALKAYGSNCGEIIDTDLRTLRPKSWHWINSNIDLATLKNRFRQLDYSISTDTVRQDSLGQQELIHLYKLQFY
uniref:Methyltransferase n=1 Tax=viral metagenome TaxID=1070528 RepID=A0A6C0IM12_9ZZZZ